MYPYRNILIYLWYELCQCYLIVAVITLLVRISQWSLNTILRQRPIQPHGSYGSNARTTGAIMASDQSPQSPVVSLIV